MAIASIPIRYRVATILGMSHQQETSLPRAVEEPLLARVARGVPGATEDVLDRYQGLVWSLARRALETQADAEDAVQDIFLDVWKSAPRFDASVAAEATFIAMIARRRLIDRRRKIGRRPATESLYDESSPPEPPTDLSEEDRETAVVAREAMAELSKDQQRVLQLSIFQGLSHEKIATATDMPLGTVKTHARRGLIKLRSIIDTRLHGRDSTREVSA